MAGSRASGGRSLLLSYTAQSVWAMAGAPQAPWRAEGEPARLDPSRQEQGRQPRPGPETESETVQLPEPVALADAQQASAQSASLSTREPEPRSDHPRSPTRPFAVSRTTGRAPCSSYQPRRDPASVLHPLATRWIDHTRRGALHLQPRTTRRLVAFSCCLRNCALPR